MSTSQQDKATRYRGLLAGPAAFVTPNPWDAGSARLLAELGFSALATSSGAAAGVLGRRDHQLRREEAMAHSRLIVEATDLPVSADLENGFGDTPEDAAETVRQAAMVGLVGCSIEDSSRNPEQPQYAFDLAVARIEAAVAAVRKLDFAFTLTARAENFVCGNPDLDDTIRRLKAFEKAGADVLFAIGIPDLNAVRAICAAVKKPVNVMCGMPGRDFAVTDLAAAGVRRISLGTALYRAAMQGARVAATAVRDHGRLPG